MKIAVFHELHSGGARRAVNEFARELKKNHLVDLYIVDDEIDKKEKNFFTNVYFYAFIPKKWIGKNWRIRLYKDTFELYALYKLHKKTAEIINKKGYDIVLVNPSKFTQAPFILRFLRLKKIYYCMEPLRLVYDPMAKITKDLDVLRYVYEKVNRWLRKIIDRQNVNCAEGFIAPSKYLAQLFSNIYKKDVQVVYCGVDTIFFTPSNKKKDIDLLFVGSRETLDGYEFFREILKNVRAGLKVKELLSEDEWLSDVQLREVYRRTKILVATSYNEPLGLVPLEAMSCGAMVVAVDEAGYKETVVENKTGFLIQRNPKRIAEKLDWLLSHSQELTRFEEQGRELMVENWTWKTCAKELESVISKCFFNKR